MSDYTTTIERDSIWQEKGHQAPGQRDIVQIFDVSPHYMDSRSVAFTIIEGRNAAGGTKARRIFTYQGFLDRFEPVVAVKVEQPVTVDELTAVWDAIESLTSSVRLLKARLDDLS